MKTGNTNITQIAVVALAFIGVVGFYFFGRTLPKETKSPVETVDHQHQNNSSIEELKTRAVEELDSNETKQWTGLSESNKEQKAEFWSSIDRNDIAAIYSGEFAQQNNTAANWNSAGDLYVRAYRESEDEEVKHYFLDKAVNAYNESLTLEENTETKLKLAKVYTDARGEVMKGVLLLQQIVEQQPKHIQANYELGLLSVRSGQQEKALNRFNTIIAEKPNFIEPYIYKAQLLIEQSDKDGAVKTIEDALEHVKTEKEKAALLNIKESIINN